MINRSEANAAHMILCLNPKSGYINKLRWRFHYESNEDYILGHQIPEAFKK